MTSWKLLFSERSTLCERGGGRLLKIIKEGKYTP